MRSKRGVQSVHGLTLHEVGVFLVCPYKKMVNVFGNLMGLPVLCNKCLVYNNRCVSITINGNCNFEKNKQKSKYMNLQE